jgi:uncharacterized membrane protein
MSVDQLAVLWVPAGHVLGALVTVLILATELWLFRFAFAGIGVPKRLAYALLALALVGARFNIPVGTLHGSSVATLVMRGPTGWVVVGHRRPETRLMVNFGGAVLPVLLSGYLLGRSRRLLEGAVAVTAVTLIVYELARPIPGIGIEVPTLLPPAAAALAALLVGRGEARRVAYVAGSLGTLMGADVLNLHRIPELGARVASIGGAGAFDGIFLGGLVATLLVSTLKLYPRLVRRAPAKEKAASTVPPFPGQPMPVA